MINKKDYHNLLRETKRYNAQLTWYKDSRVLTIAIAAQLGFVWTCNQQTLLEANISNPSNPDIREITQELIDSMQFGYIRVQESWNHDPDCECHACENHDSELEPELCFG